jgi:hypothetical protein
MTQLLVIDTDALFAKVEAAQLAHNPVVLTAEEFGDLRGFSPLNVVHPATGVWKDLGVLGYIGNTLIYDASKWNSNPFEAKPHAFD